MSAAEWISSYIEQFQAHGETVTITRGDGSEVAVLGRRWHDTRFSKADPLSDTVEQTSLVYIVLAFDPPPEPGDRLSASDGVFVIDGPVTARRIGATAIAYEIPVVG